MKKRNSKNKARKGATGARRSGRVENSLDRSKPSAPERSDSMHPAERRRDECVFDSTGKVLHFSIERFARDIGQGNCCFVCGVSPSATSFNNEHVFPDWILKRFKLHPQQITLPNRTQLTYGRYKVPCCKTCNSLMSQVFETPISRLMAQGYKAVCDHLEQEGPAKLFQWLNLIFLKTHLKDRNLRFHLDSRKSDEKISDFYSWEDLHHFHCVARAFYSGAKFHLSSLGTLLVLPAKTGMLLGDFDYRDLYVAKTMLLRLGEVGIVAVLNDCCAVRSILRKFIGKIEGPLSPGQFRELMARAASINLRLKAGPIFTFAFDEDYADQILIAQHPDIVELVEETQENKLGEILHWCFEDILPMIPENERDFVVSHIKDGRYSLILDSHGKFVLNSPV
jgi:hypothetical protein